MRTLVDHLRADKAAYAEFNEPWYSFPGFWITAIYRFGMWSTRLPPVVRHLVWVVYRVLRLSCLWFNIDLWASRQRPEVGTGLCLLHPQNVYFGWDTRIGDHCRIHHEVTFGIGPLPGNPRLGNRVVVYPGARILGGVEIGDGAVIGANCVVTRHVPPGSVVMPAPVRLLNSRLSAMARREHQTVDTPNSPHTGPHGH